jgi:hypothetical protein
MKKARLVQQLAIKFIFIVWVKSAKEILCQTFTAHCIKKKVTGMPIVVNSINFQRVCSDE